MPFAPSRPLNPDATRPSQSSAAQSRPRTARSARRRRRWRKGPVIASGVIVASLLSAIIWCEYYPAALAQAEEAYRSNRLEVALQISLGHLKRRPTSRFASLLAARCLSRLGRPDQAEAWYAKAGALDLEDLHIRAYALVLSNACRIRILPGSRVRPRAEPDATQASFDVLDRIRPQSARCRSLGRGQEMSQLRI
jgi:tetratricopeptide (TPR) repeat protein